MNKKNIEHPITKGELHNVLKSFANNKTPGSDGLTKEFYETFFDEIAIDLKNCYEENLV